MSDEVLVEYDGRTCVVTINRPRVRNAVNGAVARGVAAALEELDARDDLAVGIVTGAGGTFCAGMDLKGFLAGDLPIVEGRGFGGFAERPPRKPLIAAVEGYALAGGFEAALAADLLVAAEDARFGIPEAKRGLVAAAGGLLRLPHRLPRNVAMELALTGDFLTAPRAHELGLVNRLAPSGGALAEARRLAEQIAANAPLAVVASKRVITESADWTADEAWERQRAITDPVFGSADAMEGAAAFAEKRTPNWTGR
ncbi:crotonase/enoyl-CoA hydratase family protein [Allonocardiopsis opalescens]|uniref:Short chain enoyl-CoA hydratase n=1 Tax=Allonocardiopsis opalescens TaxID=1144618 RepID=A0A2T0Q9N4_9ACTN|nr:crotonase/enoyl-CoA hydratase family protein [Allonocardiopsis opalescens]PRY00574.1 short chain enoyl-CoA hydratase [Allonocardiopsis opalescens]